MKLESGEREIIEIYPRLCKLTATLLLLITPIMLLIRWPELVNQNFPFNKVYDLILLFLGGIISLFPRFILTTHRAIYSFGPFYRSEIERQYVHDIKIIPNPRHIVSNPDSIWLKPLFSKNKIRKDADYWRKHGFLKFVHDKNERTLMKSSLDLLPLSILSDEQSNEFIKNIQRFWNFDANRIEMANIADIKAKYASEDIGNRTPSLIIFSVLLVIAAMFAPVYLFKAQHFAVESYLWAIPLIIVMTLLAYPFIRAENKKYPYIGTICSGIFLGAALYFVSLQLNRWYSESHHSTLNSTLTLESLENNVQIWRLPPNLAENVGTDKIYVSDRISGFNNKLQPQQNYNIEIKQGFFQDYFIDSASLKNIRAIAE